MDCTSPYITITIAKGCMYYGGKAQSYRLQSLTYRTALQHIAKGV
jgi:hypothetical protein